MSNEYTNEKLKELQSLCLDEKIALSLTRIAEFNNRFPEQTYLSYSGGKDSTVLLDLVKKVIPNIPVIFSNTGLEYPEIQSFAKSKGAKSVYPEMNFKKVIETYGYPIISKEVSEAVYYARRIVPRNNRERERERADCSQNVVVRKESNQRNSKSISFKTTIRKRKEFLGLRCNDEGYG